MKHAIFFWLKLTALAFLLHVVLIIISVLEVAFYSYVINPDQPVGVYELHAHRSGPYISAIFGSLIIFLWVRRTAIKDPQNPLRVAIGLPVLYIAMDILMLELTGINWNDHFYTFLFANGSKLLAGYIAAVYDGKKRVEV